MILIDASAIVAVVCRESGDGHLIRALSQSSKSLTHPLSTWEAAVAIARNKQSTVNFGLQLVDKFVRYTRADITSIEADDGVAAVDAFNRFGKGRGHPANLNMADCFSYAMAKRRGLKLLYKGDDFAQTDIESALG
jgi:ribonuclease VapC